MCTIYLKHRCVFISTSVFLFFRSTGAFLLFRSTGTSYLWMSTDIYLCGRYLAWVENNAMHQSVCISINLFYEITINNLKINYFYIIFHFHIINTIFWYNDCINTLSVKNITSLLFVVKKMIHILIKCSWYVIVMVVDILSTSNRDNMSNSTFNKMSIYNCHTYL